MIVSGRYELDRPLGHGATAVVDLARDLALDRRVALKRLAETAARDEELRARFLREARLSARLSHPNVVRVYDVGEDGGVPFIAMEFVDGETLAELVARRGPLPPEEVVALGVQLCRGLAAVHAAGLVHRDVKPQNVLLRRDGVLKLGDFGIAAPDAGTRLTLAGTVLGTAAYLAPEQARGERVTAAADLYGAGSVLYELLTGRPPRQPTSLAELAAPAAVPPPGGAPPALAATVMRCLAADPAERPSSATVLADELSGRHDGRPTEVLLPTRRRRRPLAAALAAAAAAALGGGIAAAVVTSGGQAPPKPIAPPRVAAVGHGATAEQQARDLAAWLRRYSR